MWRCKSIIYFFYVREVLRYVDALSLRTINFSPFFGRERSQLYMIHLYAAVIAACEDTGLKTSGRNPFGIASMLSCILHSTRHSLLSRNFLTRARSHRKLDRNLDLCPRFVVERKRSIYEWMRRKLFSALVLDVWRCDFTRLYSHHSRTPPRSRETRRFILIESREKM